MLSTQRQQLIDELGPLEEEWLRRAANRRDTPRG